MLTAVTGCEIPLPNQNKWLEFKHFESVFGKRPTKKQNGDVSISFAGVNCQQQQQKYSRQPNGNQ